MTQSYPWSQSGLQLLSTIQNYIEEQGGRDALYHAVLEEINTQSDTCPESLNKITQQMIEVYGKVQRQKIPELLGIGESKACIIIAELMEAGLIKKAYQGHRGRDYSKGKRANIKQGQVRMNIVKNYRGAEY